MKKSELFKSIANISNEIESNSGDSTQKDIWLSKENEINLSDSISSSQTSFNKWGYNDFEDLSWKSWAIVSNTETVDLSEFSNSINPAYTNTKLLPRTTEYFGTLDIVNILWEKPEYTLQDSKWNYFAYYWSHLDFVDTVETLGWNVYEMVTESEILQNQLFGDRVSYINLSMFKDVRVIMVIRIDGDVWLLQIPSNKYHYSKDYLKSLFIH